MIGVRAPSISLLELGSRMLSCCRYDDPTFVKMLKIDILQEIATQDNASEIVGELGLASVTLSLH